MLPHLNPPPSPPPSPAGSWPSSPSSRREKMTVASSSSASWLPPPRPRTSSTGSASSMGSASPSLSPSSTASSALTTPTSLPPVASTRPRTRSDEFRTQRPSSQGSPSSSHRPTPDSRSQGSSASRSGNRQRSASRTKRRTPTNVSSWTAQDWEKAWRQHLKSLPPPHDETHPSCGPYYNQIGNLYFRRGDLEAAATWYHKAIACQPGEHHEAAYTNLGTWYWRQGEWETAMRCLQQALTLHQLTLHSRGETVATSAQAASIYHQMGFCHALSGFYTEALQYLRLALQIRSQVDGSTAVSVGHTYHAIGRVHWMQGNHHDDGEVDQDLAIAAYQAALACLVAAKVSTVNVLQDLAQVYLAQGEITTALAHWQQIYQQQKDTYQQAVSSLPSSSSSAFDLVQTLETLASLHQQLGDEEKAAQCRQEASLVYVEAKLPAMDLQDVKASP